MLNYMAGVKRQDGVASREVAERRSGQELEVGHRQGSLHWFGCVRRAREESTLQMEDMEISGRKPVERHKKTQRKCIQQDLDFGSA